MMIMMKGVGMGRREDDRWIDSIGDLYLCVYVCVGMGAFLVGMGFDRSI